jgi:hypothetical protein
MSLVIDEDDHAAGYKIMARQLWDTYMSKIPKERADAIGLSPLADIDRGIQDRLLDSENGFPPEVRAVLRSKLGRPPENKKPPPTSPAESPDRAEAKTP